MTDTTPSPERLRELAKGKAYPTRALREALFRAAAQMETLEQLTYDTDNLALTIGALVIASGGKIEVPPGVLEDIRSYQIEKRQDPATGSIIYTSSRKAGVATDG